VEPKIEEFMKIIDNTGDKQEKSKNNRESEYVSNENKTDDRMINLKKYVKKVRKIMAAGGVANLLLGGVFFGLYQGFTKLNLCRPYGLEIVEIEHGSPAEKYGLKVSDIIISINDTRIFTFEDLEKILQNASPGDMVAIGLLRGGEAITINLILSEKNGHAYIGVGLKQYYKSGVDWIPDFVMLDLYLFVYLSFIIGFLMVILNVLPCFILDGSRWLSLYLFEKTPKNWRRINLIINVLVTTILFLNFVVPTILRFLY
ncbi:MAG: PDZ domain-containing protein, partial [Candidatus Njordarchaeota archaeon]